MELTPVHYKVLDLAFDESSIGHLRQPALLLRGDQPPLETQPETTLPETQAALLQLLRAGLVSITYQGNTSLSDSDAERIASDLRSWSEPDCWQYEVVLTPAGEETLARLDDERRLGGHP